jgi:hypothetical protein
MARAQSQEPRVPIIALDTPDATSSSTSISLEKQSERLDDVTPDSSAENDQIGMRSRAGVRRPSFSKSTQVTISKHEGLHIIIPATASHATSSASLSYLRHCVVDLSPPTINGAPFDVLYIRNIKNSLIICGQVAGSIHITDVENSVLVTACRQFRMHASKDVDIYLHSTSRPIFEDCKGLRFAPLPETYVSICIRCYKLDQ